MMNGARRFSVAVLTITVLAALALSADAWADENQTVHVSLKDGRGGVEVTLEIRNLPEPGIEHINHIHTSGTCADDQAGRPAPVTIPLTTIAAQKDGTGSATTITKGASAAQPFDHNKEGFILLQAKAHVIALPVPERCEQQDDRQGGEEAIVRVGNPAAPASVGTLALERPVE